MNIDKDKVVFYTEGMRPDGKRHASVNVYDRVAQTVTYPSDRGPVAVKEQD